MFIPKESRQESEEKKHRQAPHLTSLLPPSTSSARIPETLYLLVEAVSLLPQNLTDDGWTVSCPINLNQCFNVLKFIQYSKHQSWEYIYRFSYLLQWNYNKFTSYFILVFRRKGKGTGQRKSVSSENSLWSFLF